MEEALGALIFAWVHHLPAVTFLLLHSMWFYLHVVASYAPPPGVYYNALHFLVGFQNGEAEAVVRSFAPLLSQSRKQVTKHLAKTMEKNWENMF